MTLQKLVGAVAVIGVFVGVLVQYIFNDRLPIETNIRIGTGIAIEIIIIVLAVIFLLVPFLKSRYKSKLFSEQTSDTALQPHLRYNDKQIRVKTWDDSSGGMTFHYSDYYLPIENTAHGIEARECKGRITISKTDIENRQMLWESGKPSIAIGHEELLRLFQISESLERKSILFYRDRLEYDRDMDQKMISVMIQSENAICPTAAYEARVGDIVKNMHS
ncbi:MAG: hypothetical protein WBX01_01960 [Nitrososphaeraceae archaeon]